MAPKGEYFPNSNVFFQDISTKLLALIAFEFALEFAFIQCGVNGTLVVSNASDCNRQ